MEEIPIAYPILDKSDQILITNIIFDGDYDFVIKYQIDNFIEITLCRSYIVYQQLITKSNIPMNKLYKLIINSLNKEPNYLININLDNDILLGIRFNTEIVDINEQIILIRQLNTKPTEILLIDKIKELEYRITEIETKPIFPYGYDINATTLEIDFNLWIAYPNIMHAGHLCHTSISYKLNNIYIEPTLLRNIEIYKLFKELNTIIINVHGMYDILTDKRAVIPEYVFKTVFDMFNHIIVNCNIIIICNSSQLLKKILTMHFKCKSITLPNYVKTEPQYNMKYSLDSYTLNNIPIYYKN